jgi:cytochrome d ubiquinol oxidase subunit II
MDGVSNPTLKEVSMNAGGWLRNYLTYPWTRALPILAAIGGLGAAAGLYYKRYGLALFSNSCMIFGIITTAGFSLFPFILPSRLNPNHSLTVWDSSSSQATLFIMLVATLIFLPIVLAYTTWAYRVMRGKVTQETVEHNINSY